MSISYHYSTEKPENSSLWKIFCLRSQLFYLAFWCFYLNFVLPTYHILHTHCPHFLSWASICIDSLVWDVLSFCLSHLTWLKSLLLKTFFWAILILVNYSPMNSCYVLEFIKYYMVLYGIMTLSFLNSFGSIPLPNQNKIHACRTCVLNFYISHRIECLCTWWYINKNNNLNLYVIRKDIIISTSYFLMKIFQYKPLKSGIIFSHFNDEEIEALWGKIMHQTNITKNSNASSLAMLLNHYIIWDLYIR